MTTSSSPPPEGTMVAGVQTWSLLPSLGFVADFTVRSDIHPCMRLRQGGLNLCASGVMSQRLEPVVLFTGICFTARAGSHIEFELPRQVDSPEFALAMLAYCLRGSVPESFFQSEGPLPWLAEGRSHKRSLPWERKWALERAEAADRPLCTVEREWMRLALKRARAAIEGLAHDTPVTFAFDGGCVIITAATAIIRVQADGTAWLDPVLVPAGNLNNLPKRLDRDPVLVEVCRAGLRIGNRLLALEAKRPGNSIGPDPDLGLLPGLKQHPHTG